MRRVYEKPAFVAEYKLALASPITPLIEPMLIILPKRLFFIFKIIGVIGISLLASFKSLIPSAEILQEMPAAEAKVIPVITRVSIQTTKKSFNFLLTLNLKKCIHHFGSTNSIYFLN